MMKLLGIMLICAFLLDICCAIPRPQRHLKEKCSFQDLFEKPLVLTKRDGNNNHKKLPAIPQVRHASITPDMIMPQPLNLRLNNNYKQTYNPNRSKMQEIPSNKKVTAMPIDRIQPPALKQNVTDHVVDINIPKVSEEKKINDIKKFFTDTEDSNDYDGYNNTGSKLDHKYQAENKIIENLSNKTKSLSQPPVTETEASDVKPNISSIDKSDISVTKQESVVDKVLKGITNAIKTVVNNTDAIKCNTERTTLGLIANHEMPNNKIINQESNSQIAINIIPRDNHDNEYINKIEINVFPRSLVNDRRGTIVIKNHDCKEVIERRNSGLAVNSSQELALNDNLDPVPKTNGLYAPDTTFIKLPYKYPIDYVNNFSEFKKGEEFKAENNVDDLRDKVWKTWKDTEIHIKSNDEYNASDKEYAYNPYKATYTSFSNQMKPATCSWCYSPQYRSPYYPTSYYSYYDPCSWNPCPSYVNQNSY